MSILPDVDAHLERRWPFGWRLKTAVGQRNVAFLANAVAFQAFTALLPLLVVLAVLASLFGGDAFADRVLALTEGVLPAPTRAPIVSAVSRELVSGPTTVVGVALLLWGSLNLFEGLDTAFSIVYDTAAQNSVLDRVRDALVAFGSLALGFLAAVVAGGFAVLTRLPAADVLSPVVLAGVLTVVFLPMYVVFPDARVTVRQALPGALVAGVGWAVLQTLFQFYVAVAMRDNPAGAIGAVLVLFAWLYLGSFLLLIGATTNAVRAGEIPVAQTPAPEPTTRVRNR